MAKKILIIDDEDDFCYFVKLNLEQTGKFEVLVATNGPSGINLARTQQPDLILLDLLMPGMHGSEVAEALLNDSTTRHIPVVFLTALAQKREVEKSKGTIGGRQFIAKPVTPEELIFKIESILGKE
jgi:CheY-like chemotaxis protein